MDFSWVKDERRHRLKKQKQMEREQENTPPPPPPTPPSPPPLPPLSPLPLPSPPAPRAVFRIRGSILPVKNSIVPFCLEIPIGHENEEMTFSLPSQMNVEKLKRVDCHKIIRMLADMFSSSQNKVSFANIYCSTYLPASELRFLKPGSSSSTQVSKYSTKKESRERGIIGLNLYSRNDKGEHLLATVETRIGDLFSDYSVTGPGKRFFSEIFDGSDLIALMWSWESPDHDGSGHAMLVVIDEENKTAQLLDPNGGRTSSFFDIFKQDINELVLGQLKMLFRSCERHEYKVTCPKFDDFNGFRLAYQRMMDEKLGLQYKGDKHGLCLFVSIYFLSVYMCGSAEQVFKPDFWKRRFNEITGADPFPARRAYHALMYFRAFVFLLVEKAKNKGVVKKTIWGGPMITYTRPASDKLQETSASETKEYNVYTKPIRERIEAEEARRVSAAQQRSRTTRSGKKVEPLRLSERTTRSMVRRSGGGRKRSRKLRRSRRRSRRRTLRGSRRS